MELPTQCTSIEDVLIQINTKPYANHPTCDM